MARVLISLPDKLLEALSNYCVSYNYNRSECIRRAIRDVVYGDSDVMREEEDET